MKRPARKIWIWILSGLGLILGGCFLSHRDAPCVYGPPAPEINTDSEPVIDTVEEPQQNDLN